MENNESKIVNGVVDHIEDISDLDLARIEKVMEERMPMEVQNLCADGPLEDKIKILDQCYDMTEGAYEIVLAHVFGYLRDGDFLYFISEDGDTVITIEFDKGTDNIYSVELDLPTKEEMTTFMDEVGDEYEEI